MTIKQPVSNTFGSILDMYRGAGPGFDFLRIALSLLILLSHTSKLTGHSGFTAALTEALNQVVHFFVPASATQLPLPGTPGASNLPAGGLSGPFVRSLVPMFFALSGFLVTGSAIRTQNLIRFLGLRALRIFPALVVEVFLSAIIIGGLFTTLPLNEYFSHPEFFAYFFNTIGYVHFNLPGVFKQSFDTAVNANLWTLPFELECYILMSLFILFGLLKKRTLLTSVYILATCLLIYANVALDYEATLGTIGGRVLVYYFATGIIFFLWREKIRYSPTLLVICVVVSYALFLSPKSVFIAPVFLTYLVIYLGLTKLPQPSIIKSGDYSYGIYLYGFPATQAVVAVIGPSSLNFVFTVFLASIASFACAYFSWHGVEKHCLKLKRFISGRREPNLNSVNTDASSNPLGSAGVVRRPTGEVV